MATRSGSTPCQDRCLEILWNFSDFCQPVETLSSGVNNVKHLDPSHQNKHLKSGRTSLGLQMDTASVLGSVTCVNKCVSGNCDCVFWEYCVA